MGGVGAAGASGAEAVFLNPAALGKVLPESPSEAALEYDALLESAYTGSAAYARPAGASGAFAAGLIYASQGAQTRYSAVGDATGKFTPNDLALGGWYARRLGGLTLAGGLKLIRSALDDRSGVTAAADIGATAKHVADLGDGELDVGAALQHLGPPLKLGGASDPLPARLRAGGLWRATPNVDAAFDLNLPVDADPYVSVGFEARLAAAKAGSKKPWTVSARGGYDQNRARGVEGFAGFSAGAGFDFAALRLDYAWIPFGDLGSQNKITVAFRF